MRTSRRRRDILMALSGLLVLAAGVPGGSLDRLVPDGRRGTPPPAKLVSNVAELPLQFEANRGQTTPEVLFLARAAGYTAVLTAEGAAFAVPGAPPVHMDLVGRDRSGAVTPQDPLPGTANYLIGHDPSEWQNDVPTYGSVRYGDVYPGVDVVFYGNQQRLEHDFVVAPGADPGAITLGFHGSSNLVIDGHGDLVIGAAEDELRLERPVVYQERDRTRERVPGAFAWKGDGTIGFEIGAYDHTRPLVIDPVLQGSTYLGGNGTDSGYAVAVDGSGNVYVTGITQSPDFPLVRAVQPALAREGDARGTDVFVAKLSPDGSAILSSTYLGGKGARDVGAGIAVGSDGSVYVAGSTDSPDFPLTSPLQGNYGGGASDAFVAKMTADGSSVAYATFLGGDQSDVASSIAVDQQGNVHVTGTTKSPGFPTAQAVQRELSPPDQDDAFVAKIDPAGAALVYSTFLGGPADDQGRGIALDDRGNAYVTGSTRSPTFPTVGPAQGSFGGTSGDASASDAFVTKLDPAGTSILYSTYLGGDGSDLGAAITVDGGGSAYVTGSTGSTNFPTARPLQARKDGDFDGFVTKLDPTGGAVEFSTHLGGAGSDGGADIVVDQQGRAVIVGTTASDNFPLEAPYQPNKGGGLVDAYVSVLNANGSAFVWSTFIGGRDEDNAASVAIDNAGTIHFVGYTNSPDLPTARPLQANKGGGVGDAFVAKFVDQPITESAAAGGSGNASREGRIRLLTAITLGLFASAVIHTLFIRRRLRTRPPSPPGPEVLAPAPTPDWAPASSGGSSPPAARSAPSGVTIVPPDAPRPDDPRPATVPGVAPQVGAGPAGQVPVPDLLRNEDDRWSEAVVADDAWSRRARDARPQERAELPPWPLRPPVEPSHLPPGEPPSPPAGRSPSPSEAPSSVPGKVEPPDLWAPDAGPVPGPVSPGLSGPTAAPPASKSAPSGIEAEPAPATTEPRVQAEQAAGPGGGDGPDRLSVTDLLAEDLSSPPGPTPPLQRPSIADLLAEDFAIPDLPREGTPERAMSDTLAEQLAESLTDHPGPTERPTAGAPVPDQAAPPSTPGPAAPAATTPPPPRDPPVEAAAPAAWTAQPAVQEPPAAVPAQPAAPEPPSAEPPGAEPPSAEPPTAPPLGPKGATPRRRSKSRSRPPSPPAEPTDVAPQTFRETSASPSTAGQAPSGPREGTAQDPRERSADEGSDDEAPGGAGKARMHSSRRRRPRRR